MKNIIEIKQIKKYHSIQNPNNEKNDYNKNIVKNEENNNENDLKELINQLTNNKNDNYYSNQKIQPVKRNNKDNQN